MILTGLAVMSIKGPQKATYARYIVGAVLVIALGFVALRYMTEPGAYPENMHVNPWAVLVCGLCIYTLVHTLEINGTSRRFKAMVFVWAAVIAGLSWGVGLGLDTGVSLVLAVFFDYILKIYESWLKGNPVRASYEEKSGMESRENLKSKKVLKRMYKRHEISDMEYRLARDNRQNAYLKERARLNTEYLQNLRKSEEQQPRFR